jgi:hypothetical protein
MSQSTIVTGPEAVELARQMREAGVQRFVLTSERFSAVLSPPPPPKMSAINDQIAELTGEERRALLTTAQKEYEADLYGAAR